MITIAVLVSVAGNARATGAPNVVIDVLSNRADLISGGDALVAVSTPDGVDPSTATIDVNGRDVTDEFEHRPNGKFEGLVTGLGVGSNLLSVHLPDGGGARMPITNHPIGGPVFSGPQVQPWMCAPGALDERCDRPITYSYQYRSIQGSFQSYDPGSPPAAPMIAQTTTDQGVTVPYIVRVESGTEDRSDYQIAVLFDPSKPWMPWAPQPAWDQKMTIEGGSSCGTLHAETSAPSVLDNKALSRGFAVMATALDNNGNDCDPTLQAESLMMAKEHFIESYGEIRYTIGQGGSGGAILQQAVANAYPGIYDGITPAGSFPDSLTPLTQVDDCNLLLSYWNDPTRWDTGVAWTESQQAAVAGDASIAPCVAWVHAYGFPGVWNPSSFNGGADVNGTVAHEFFNCGVPASQIYNAQTNPKGVRCSFQDWRAVTYGSRANDGFANRPLGNEGVQYGLGALRSAAITPAQFVDLNAKIGSHDIDYNWQSGRVAPDLPAVGASYRAGTMNEANNLAGVPIIDLRLHDIGEIHADFRSYVMRARLDRSNGGHGNQVIWDLNGDPYPFGVDETATNSYFEVMDQWLSAIAADDRDVPRAQKVIEDRPTAAHDTCHVTDAATVDDRSVCSAVAPFYSDPRIVAGEPFTEDVIACPIKALDRSDYYPIQFTDTEWAQLERTFPTGVCDYSKPGVDQQQSQPWLTFENQVGGRPLGPAPESAPM